MTEPVSAIDEIERYWKAAGISRSTVADMRFELEQHLRDAEQDGRTLTDVLGKDPGDFAQSWAAAYRGKRETATWADFRSGSTDRHRKNRRDLLWYSIGTLAVVAGATVAGQGGSDVDNEVWRWLWTVFALVMGIGEIFTAGFFLLPFAIGAAAAAILAWFNVVVIAQWLVFFGVSIFSMAYLRKFIERQDEGEQPVLGANRWVTKSGIVLEDIDPDSGSGMVKVDTEEWRATSHQHIPQGTRIVVIEVSGTRLLVEPVESA